MPAESRTLPTLSADGRIRDSPVGTVSLPSRYEDLGLIGHGGGGSIRRVRDTHFDRVLAMKVALPDDDVARRLDNEARVTARLQHPGVVAVHERGVLEDGRSWFTMKEIRGETLSSAIERAHRAGWPEPGPLRRVIDAFATVCRTLAYAHSRGVIHCDLKPANLMLGEFGAVQVVDWGSARLLDGPQDATGQGGTPPYLAPEQAERGRLSKATDVYALGAVLYHVLSGRGPYVGSPVAMWRAVQAGPPTPLSELLTEAQRGPVAELVSLCELALSRAPTERPPDASHLAEAVTEWLDGVQRRERAEQLAERAGALLPQAQEQRKEGARLHRSAREAAQSVPAHAPATAKAESWSLERRAADHRRDAALLEAEGEQLLREALHFAPSLEVAARRLRSLLRARLERAEHDGHLEDAVHAIAQLRGLGDSTWLQGDGALTLVTDPPGVQVRLHRYELVDERLVPGPAQELGTSPLNSVPVPRGSSLLTLHAPGHQEVLYPIFVGREEHWDGVAPGETSPHPIRVPRRGELSPGERYVPPGWFTSGGDSQAIDGLERRRLWCDGFVIRAHPVTCAEYLEFLNRMLDRGERAAAEQLAPAEVRGSSEVLRPVWELDAAGRYRLGADLNETPWQPDWPVTLVDWHAAGRFAAELGAETGLAWRLPHDQEREKAVRGVDGRWFPWGGRHDPAFANMSRSLPGEPRRSAVTQFADDRSPYGVLGGAGNVREWCLNGYRRDGPPTERVSIPDPGSSLPPDDSYRMVRGGSWYGTAASCRVASRFVGRPRDRLTAFGFRLARSF